MARDKTKGRVPMGRQMALRTAGSLCAAAIVAPLTVIVGSAAASAGSGFSASPSPVLFGSVPLGTTVSKTVTITPDTGFQLGGVGDSSGLNAPFGLSQYNCGSVVGPQTCTFVESFTPTTTGPASGALFLDEFMSTPSGVVNQNLEVDVSGTGVIPTALTATPAVVQLAGLSLWRFTLNAHLTAGGVGVAGQTVVFTSGSTYLCTAVTAGNGAASCSGVAGLLSIVLSSGYNATFDGTATLAPSTAHAGLIG